MVELMTPQLDTGSDSSYNDEEGGEEEGEEEGEEDDRVYAAALSDKRKASSINTRMHEWLNSIEIGKEEDYSDTSF